MNIVFSFDDGRDDAYNAYLILKKYKLVGSFHITTGFMDGTFKTDAFGEKRKPIKVEHLLEMSNDGMDISSHGDRHIMDSDDFNVSLEKLEKIGISKQKFGFSVPNSEFTLPQLNFFRDNNIGSLSYIRVGRSKKCYSFLNKVNYFLYHIFHFQYFYNHFNSNNLMDNIDKYFINSLVVLSDTKPVNLIKFIDKYKGTNKTLVLMFHSIVELSSNKWEYSSTDFDKICEFVSRNCDCVSLERLVN